VYACTCTHVQLYSNTWIGMPWGFGLYFSMLQHGKQWETLFCYNEIMNMKNRQTVVIDLETRCKLIYEHHGHSSCSINGYTM